MTTNETYRLSYACDGKQTTLDLTGLDVLTLQKALKMFHYRAILNDESLKSVEKLGAFFGETLTRGEIMSSLKLLTEMLQKEHSKRVWREKNMSEYRKSVYNIYETYNSQLNVCLCSTEMALKKIIAIRKQMKDYEKEQPEDVAVEIPFRDLFQSRRTLKRRIKLITETLELLEKQSK